MSKMSKIDQIHLRAVMLCMSKMSKMGKEHTHTFFIIPFLIWYHLNVMLSMSKMLKIDQITANGCNAIDVEDIKDRSNTPKGCNAMYVGDVEDGKRTYTYFGS